MINKELFLFLNFVTEKEVFEMINYGGVPQGESD